MLNRSRFLGQRMAYRREKLGLKQTELAVQVGTNSKYISDLEAGRKIPSLLLLARIAAALGVTMDDLNRREQFL